jgi:hypothetical protein
MILLKDMKDEMSDNVGKILPVLLMERNMHPSISSLQNSVMPFRNIPKSTTAKLSS